MLNSRDFPSRPLDRPRCVLVGYRRLPQSSNPPSLLVDRWLEVVLGICPVHSPISIKVKSVFVSPFLPGVVELLARGFQLFYRGSLFVPYAPPFTALRGAAATHSNAPNPSRVLAGAHSRSALLLDSA